MNRGIRMDHPLIGTAMITSYRKSVPPVVSNPSTSPPNMIDKGESHKVHEVGINKPQDKGDKS